MIEKEPVMAGKAPVLVVRATGKVGRLVVENVLDRDKRVRTLVRPTPDTPVLEGGGVEIARGDMFDPSSLAGGRVGAARRAHRRARQLRRHPWPLQGGRRPHR